MVLRTMIDRRAQYITDFAFAIVQCEFDTVLDALRGYFGIYYDEMYPDRRIDCRGFEHWGAAAKWPIPYAASHLDAYEFKSQAGVDELDLSKLAESLGADIDKLISEGVWGDVRLAKPSDNADQTVFDFPARSLDWGLINFLCFATSSKVYSFRYQSGPPLFSEFMVFSRAGIEREVRVTWSDIVSPKPGAPNFRQRFEQHGKPLGIENEAGFEARKPVDRMTLSDLLVMIERIAPNAVTALQTTNVPKAVMISGQSGAEPLRATQANRLCAQNAIADFKLERSPYLHQMDKANNG